MRYVISLIIINVFVLFTLLIFLLVLTLFQITIGISDHAQQELGEIVYVSLPKLGESFSKGDTIVKYKAYYNFKGAIESVKTAADIYCPIDSALVLEVNDNLNDKPKLINEASQMEGWLTKLKVNRTLAIKAYGKFLL